MKARLYHDTRKKHRNCVDAWSIYFPYPKRMREQKQTYGTFLGCKPTEYGMIRCTWDFDEFGMRPYLGKRVDVKTTSKAFQEIFYHLEKLWNDVITTHTDEALEAWLNA